MPLVIFFTFVLLLPTRITSTNGLRLRTTRDTDEQSYNWLINSNKIALGYNPIKGDPVCFTGDCRMNGFGREVFKLNYVKAPAGSCLSKLIPEHVELSCMPSTDMRAKTEIISDYNQLKESISKGSDSGVGLSLGPISFKYGESEQTTKMINDIYIWNYTLFYTYVKQSYVRLASYSPLMELSEAFRMTIKEMPYGTDNFTETFIKRRLFEDFGFAYLSEVHLGGIAQQLITMESRTIEKYRSEGRQTSEEAGFSFIISFSQSETEKYDKETHSKFMREVQNIQISTIGGHSYDMLTSNSSGPSPSLNKWLETIPSNPAIIKFKLESILDLITEDHFPDDPFIKSKAEAVERVMIAYANGTSVNCYNSCTSPTNGVCQATAPANLFAFGTCKCNPGFTEHDCSAPVIPTAPTPPTTPINTPLSF